jgi:hypothetical protein
VGGGEIHDTAIVLSKFEVPLLLEMFGVLPRPETPQARFSVYFLANFDNPSQIPTAMFLGIDGCSFD